MTFDRRRSELEARSLRRLDLPRVYHENQIAELDAHNSQITGVGSSRADEITQQVQMKGEQAEQQDLPSLLGIKRKQN